jgi:hypothetical protein
MSYWGFTVELEELLSVCAILGAIPPSETEGEGVWVRSVNGTRVWSASTNGTLWEVQGESVGVPIEARCLPGRLVWEARILAHTSENHEVTISIPDDIVCLVTSDVGSAVLDLPRETEIQTYPMYVADQASAKTTVGALYDLIYRARMIPAGPSNDDFPDARLFIDELGISIYVDWSICNGSRTTCRIPAEVTGTTDRLVHMGVIFGVIRDLDRDLEITIRVPVQAGIPLLVEGEEFRVAVACTATGALRHHEQVQATLLAMNGFRTRTVDTGKFFVASSSRDFAVELIDRPIETLSVHTEVCRDVPLSLELLTQLNETNSSLIGSRMWVIDDVVWAGLELPVSAIDDLAQAIRALDHQLLGFDVFLSGLSSAR